MKRLFSWGIALVLGLSVLGFFYQTIFFHLLPIPTDTLVGLYHPWRDQYASQYPRGIPFKNFLITDPVRQQIPWKKLVVESWKEGKRPSWNPYTFMGVPLDANVQAASFYPFTILFLFLNFSSAWSLLIILQPVLAGLFMYVYLRRLKVSWMAAGVGMLSWIYGGFAVSWLTWGTIVHTALWLPLMLVCVDELAHVGKKVQHYALWCLLLTCAIVMTVFAGHIQVALYTLLLSVLYFGYRMTKPAIRITTRWVLGAVCVSGLITSVQWMPLLQFAAESGRVSALDTWKNAGWFLPWQHLVQFVAPDFFGNPATLNYWGEWNYGEFIGYIGVIPFIFALSAMALKGLSGFFTLTTIISLVLMVPNPISSIVYVFHVPVLSSLQPTRLMVLVDFSLAVLSAIGFDHYIKGNTKSTRMSAFVFGVGIVILWAFVFGAKMFTNDVAFLDHLLVAKRNLIMPTVLFVGLSVWLGVFGFIRKPWLRQVGFFVLLMIVVCDVYRFGWKYTPFTNASYFFSETTVIRFLKSQPKPFRIMSLDDRIVPPNVSAYYGIETIEGYDPIAPKNYEMFLVASERGKADANEPSGYNRIYTARNIDSMLLPYFNVKYILTLTDVKRPFLKEVFREGETRVYEYTNVLPRVYLSDIVRRVYSPDEELSALTSIVSGKAGVSDGSASVMNVPLYGDESAQIYEYRADRIKIQTRTINERLLVVLNRYDPHWTATIDGVRKAKVVRANYLFTGVVVPPGSHDIILSYR